MMPLIAQIREALRMNQACVVLESLAPFAGFGRFGLNEAENCKMKTPATKTKSLGSGGYALP